MSDKRLVISTQRSSAGGPLNPVCLIIKPGIIVIVEDHDFSFEQSGGFFYTASLTKKEAYV